MTQIPPPPPGFQLDVPANAPPPAAGGIAPPPPGFQLDQVGAAVSGESPGMAALRANFMAHQPPPPQPAQDVSANPQASSLPGPLGQLANTSNALSTGAQQGMTLGWGDELGAAMMTPIDMIRKGTWDVPGTFSGILKDVQGQNANNIALNPTAAGVGDTLGSLSLIGKAPMTAPARAVLPTFEQAVRGGVTGGTFGAINGAGRGTTLQDRIGGAIKGGSEGLATGAAVGTVIGHSTQAPKPVAPDIAALDAVKTAAYAHADQLGVVYSHTGYDKLVNDLGADALKDNINPKLHPAAFETLDQMARKPPGYAPTLTQLDQLRQQVSRDVMTKDPGERHFGMQMIEGIDGFIDNAKNAHVAAGSGPDAAAAITAARAANAILRKTQTVHSLIQNAELQAGSTNSGGNINNAIRQQFKTLLKVDNRGMSKAQKQGFTPAEIHQMANITLGGTKENAMRFLGNLLKPNAITAGPWALGIAAFPPLAALPAGGMLLKRLADTGTTGKAAKLASFAAAGGNVPTAQISAPWQQLLSRAPGQAALLGPRLRPPFRQPLPDGSYQ